MAQAQTPVPPQFTALWPFWNVQLPLEADPLVTAILLPPSEIAIWLTKNPEVGPLSVKVAVPDPTFRTAVYAPCVKVVILFAEAVGAMNSAATRTKARTEGLKLEVCTTKSPWGLKW